MRAKISKSQIEVWEWKEKLYEEMKHLPMSERLRLIHERTKDTIAEIEKNRERKKQEIS